MRRINLFFGLISERATRRMHAVACVRCIYNKTCLRTPVAILPVLASEWITYVAVGWEVAVSALEGIRRVV